VTPKHSTAALKLRLWGPGCKSLGLFLRSDQTHCVTPGSRAAAEQGCSADKGQSRQFSVPNPTKTSTSKAKEGIWSRRMLKPKLGLSCEHSVGKHVGLLPSKPSAAHPAVGALWADTVEPTHDANPDQHLEPYCNPFKCLLFQDDIQGSKKYHVCTKPLKLKLTALALGLQPQPPALTHCWAKEEKTTFYTQSPGQPGSSSAVFQLDTLKTQPAALLLPQEPRAALTSSPRGHPPRSYLTSHRAPSPTAAPASAERLRQHSQARQVAVFVQSLTADRYLQTYSRLPMSVHIPIPAHTLSYQASRAKHSQYPLAYPNIHL